MGKEGVLREAHGRGLRFLLSSISDNGFGNQYLEDHPSIELYEAPLSEEVILQCFEDSFHNGSRTIDNFDFPHIKFNDQNTI